MLRSKLPLILSVFCWMTGDTCKAEPGREVVQLMDQPVSLFEWGLIRLQRGVENLVRLEPLQHQGIQGPEFEWLNSSVIYDEAVDKLNISFRLRAEDRGNREHLCRNTIAYVKENLTAGWDSEDPSDVTFVGSAFLPYTFIRRHEYSEADIRRGRYMDSIAHIDVVVQADRNPHEFTQCSSRLTENDMSIREFPPTKAKR